MQKLLKIQILKELESFVLRIWSRTEHLTNCFYSDLLIKLPLYPEAWGSLKNTHSPRSSKKLLLFPTQTWVCYSGIPNYSSDPHLWLSFHAAFLAWQRVYLEEGNTLQRSRYVQIYTPVLIFYARMSFSSLITALKCLRME